MQGTGKGNGITDEGNNKKEGLFCRIHLRHYTLFHAAGISFSNRRYGSVGGCFVFTVYCVDADGYFPDQAGKEKAPVELQTAGYDGPYPFGI